MKELGILEGDGQLLLVSGRRTDVRYRMEVIEESNGDRWANGRLFGEASALASAAIDRRPTLQLGTGGTVVILVVEHDPFDQTAQFIVNGPVPDF